MTPDTPTHEMKSPMPKSAATAVANTVTSRSTEMNLLKQALSRSRMRSPQNVSEAHRSARRVAMEARHQQARELGNLSVYGVR